jgi:hypothetical protein
MHWPASKTEDSLVEKAGVYGKLENASRQKIFSPKLTLPDWQLNLPSSNYVALQKLEDDVIGETAECTRHWADYTAF